MINRKITFNFSSNLELSIFLNVMMVFVMIFVSAWLKVWLFNLAVTKGYIKAEGTVTWFDDNIFFIIMITIPSSGPIPVHHQPAAEEGKRTEREYVSSIFLILQNYLKFKPRLSARKAGLCSLSV